MIGGVAPQMGGNISVNLVTPDFINSSYNSEYYLIFKNPSPLEILNSSDSEYLKILKIKLLKSSSPEVVLVDADKWDGLKKNPVISAEEHAINSEILLTKLKVLNTPSHLQLKNAYNKGWRLHKISEQDWNIAHSGNELSKTILKTKLYLGSFFGVRPVNIEYYSLGWDIGTQEGYYSVVYLPGAITYFAWGFSILFAAIMLVKLR